MRIALKDCIKIVNFMKNANFLKISGKNTSVWSIKKKKLIKQLLRQILSKYHRKNIISLKRKRCKNINSIKELQKKHFSSKDHKRSAHLDKKLHKSTNFVKRSQENYFHYRITKKKKRKNLEKFVKNPLLVSPLIILGFLLCLGGQINGISCKN